MWPGTPWRRWGCWLCGVDPQDGFAFPLASEGWVSPAGQLARHPTPTPVPTASRQDVLGPGASQLLASTQLLGWEAGHPVGQLTASCSFFSSELTSLDVFLQDAERTSDIRRNTGNMFLHKEHVRNGKRCYNTISIGLFLCFPEHFVC